MLPRFERDAIGGGLVVIFPFPAGWAAKAKFWLPLLEFDKVDVAEEYRVSIILLLCPFIIILISGFAFVEAFEHEENSVVNIDC